MKSKTFNNSNNLTSDLELSASSDYWTAVRIDYAASILWKLPLVFFLSCLHLPLLKHKWNHVNMFETGVVRANEC